MLYQIDYPINAQVWKQPDHVLKDRETSEVISDCCEKPFTQCKKNIGLHALPNYELKMVQNNYMEGVCNVDL